VSALANPWRGEAALVVEGVEPLFALVERASEGKLALGELVALFWHCLATREGLSREQLGEAVVAQGLSAVAPQLRMLLGQILQGEA